MIHNYSSLIGFIISLVCLAVYIFFLAPRQAIEVLEPRDWLTNLRRYILAMLLISILTAVPSTIYQGLRAFGGDSEAIRNLSTITANVSKLSTTILLVLIYTYKYRGHN